VLWLLDQCPPDYRAYAGWRRHPIALAWLAGRHIDGQVVAMRDAWREARVAIGPHVLAIPGTGDPAHLEENIAAASLRLTDGDLRTLGTLA
jgi:aryl-alcohol dehydrogenase-like predicted oxidoreductase